MNDRGTNFVILCKQRQDKFAQEINIIATKIFEIEEVAVALELIIDRYNSHLVMYSSYSQFWALIFCALYDRMILGIGCLLDDNKNSLSVVNALKNSCACGACPELMKIGEVLNQIKKHPMYAKVKQIRNKLGRAHIDKKISTNPVLMNEYREKSKAPLIDFRRFTVLLKKSMEFINGDRSLIGPGNGRLIDQIGNVFELQLL